MFNNNFDSSMVLASPQFQLSAIKYCSKNMAHCSKRKVVDTNCSKNMEGYTNCCNNMEG